jgi:hypothetical protein
MMDTGILRTFIPKEWAEANKLSADKYPELLSLQTLNKVFMYNTVGGADFKNCWDFVSDGKSGMYMDVNSELVGKNFLYMLNRISIYILGIKKHLKLFLRKLRI